MNVPMVNNPFSLAAESAVKSSPRKKVTNPMQSSFRQDPDWLIIFASALFILSLLIAWLVIGVD